MGIIWSVVIIGCSIYVLICGGGQGFVTLVYDGCDSAVELILSLGGIMAFWGGFMEIAERGGITEIIAKILSPVIKLIFPSTLHDKKANQLISMNVTANLLGLGNAATPLGINAMKRLESINNKPLEASNSMVTFVILNTSSVQLVPVTTAALRAKYGSNAPMSILPAVLLASVASLIVGLVTDRLLQRGGR